jgi:large subunit ribosomal protein L10
MDRAEKSELVTSLNQVFKDTGTVVVAHYAGLSVAEMTAFRARMREAGAGVKVAKNRLAKLALKGTDAETIADLFKGPTVVAYSSDPVAAARVAIDFAKTNEKLVILGGAMGKQGLDANGVKALASLPSLDELRAKLVGMIQTPATRVASVVAAPAGQIARVIGAHARKSEAA